MENMENKDTMENINQVTWDTLFIFQKTLFVTQNTTINHMAQNFVFFSTR